MAAKYIVGIDLGTTNSVLAYASLEGESPQIELLPIPQLVAAGTIESRTMLPSFMYLATEAETRADSLDMPWTNHVPYAVGEFARRQGAEVPQRTVGAAKSWLAYNRIDRRQPILPWNAPVEVAKVSPVTASQRYLEHLVGAWREAFPDAPIDQQHVVLTVPASFDASARELRTDAEISVAFRSAKERGFRGAKGDNPTDIDSPVLSREAALAAGLPESFLLLEEPQAAVYAWLDDVGDRWRKQLKLGDKLLVADVGGGTTDLTLVGVGQQDGELVLERLAVGNHLLVGGDNMDLALAHYVAGKFAERGVKLDPWQSVALWHSCRTAKETLLSAGGPDVHPVTVLGRGSRLIGKTVSVEVDRQSVMDLLVDGFFPRSAASDRPGRRTASGFRELGLPFDVDTAITRHLAAFLQSHGGEQGKGEQAQGDKGDRHHLPTPASGGCPPFPEQSLVQPTDVLFNGGVFKANVLRERLLEVLTGWFRREEPDWNPLVLDNDRLDLAVARGAAYYGMVRRGQGERIAAGLARTYYIGVESDPPAAVCLVPAGVEPGQDVDLTSRPFNLLMSEPVEFPLLVSSTRLVDKPDQLVLIDRQQMTPLPPIHTVLRTRKKDAAGTIAVNLHARLTEIGTLDLWCSEIGGRGSWRLVFDVRSATQSDIVARETTGEREGLLDEETWLSAGRLIDGTFGPEGQDPPEGLLKRLAAAVGSNRNQWPSSLLRRIWDALVGVEPGRRRSPIHEARWLNLLGLALRPGYGMALDDWRVDEAWRLLQGNLVHEGVMCRAEWWILWRRIAGGLSAGQQQALADPLLGPLRGLHHQMTTGRGRGGEFSVGSHETAEVWRLLGSFELLSAATKMEFGAILLDLMPKRKMQPVRPAIAWAIGRLGARVPFYGPLNTVVAADEAAAWLKRLMDADLDDPMADLAVMQMARLTGDRYRDLPEKVRSSAAAHLLRRSAPAHFITLVREGGELDTEEQCLVFGESLPKGLRLG